ncbi:hypothetical protein ACNKHW_23195 [Shigella flexneri]
MLPEVQRVARYLAPELPGQAKALMQRWLPERTQYTNVYQVIPEGGLPA